MNLFTHPLALDQIGGGAVGTVMDPSFLCADGRHHEIQDVVAEAAAEFKFPENGQEMVPLPAWAYDMVVSGAIERPAVPQPEMFKPRIHRGEVVLVGDRAWFQKKGADLTPAFVGAVVYTADAFLADRQVTQAARDAFTEMGATHALINIIGSHAPKPPVSSHRFVRNLAGGNRRYRDMLEGLEGLSVGADELLGKIEEECKAIAAYEEKWLTLG